MLKLLFFLSGLCKLLHYIEDFWRFELWKIVIFFIIHLYVTCSQI